MKLALFGPKKTESFLGIWSSVLHFEEIFLSKAMLEYFLLIWFENQPTHQTAYLGFFHSWGHAWARTCHIHRKRVDSLPSIFRCMSVFQKLKSIKCFLKYCWLKNHAMSLNMNFETDMVFLQDTRAWTIDTFDLCHLTQKLMIKFYEKIRNTYFFLILNIHEFNKLELVTWLIQYVFLRYISVLLSTNMSTWSTKVYHY